MTRVYTETEMLAAYTQGINNGLTNPGQWLIDYFQGGERSDSGVNVTYQSSLTYAYVFAAVQLISADIATLPLNVYDLDAEGDRTLSAAHPAQWLLNDEPNDLMDALTLREVIQSHALLWGNGYAAIERDGAGRPRQLVPLLPDRTYPALTRSGELIYESFEEYPRRGDKVTIRREDVLHLKGLGYDGVAGHSVITLARNSWGLGMAAQKHGSTHFANGARPSIVLETEAKLDKETADMLLARWEERHGKSANRPALLTQGLKVHPFSMSNEDAQWLESRKFQRVEVAAWFNLPPHKIGDDARLSYNSIEAENRAYLNQCLRKWLSKWESECRRKLLADRIRRNRTRTIKHDTQDLLTADIETQVDILTKLREQQVVTGNEVRRRLGMGRAEGLDDFVNPNTTASPSSPASEPAESEAATMAARRLAADRLGRFLAIEAREAIHNASTSGNFVKWLDAFYSTLSEKIGDAMEPLIVAYSAWPGVRCRVTASEAARMHVEESRRQLLDVTGYCYDQETLVEHVTQTVADWPQRAEQWANEHVETSYVSNQ